MGTLAAEIVGYAVHAPTVLHIPLCVSCAFLGSDLGEPSCGFFGVYIGVNELVVCAS